MAMKRVLLALVPLGALGIAAFAFGGATSAAATAARSGGGATAAADAAAAAADAAAADEQAAGPRTFPAPHLRNLVLVACHAVYTGVDFHLADRESSWFLEPYQRSVEGQAQSFVDHVRLGAELAARDPSALLLFSGGQTRSAAGPRSEGLSYWVVAEAAGWFPEATGAAAAGAEAARGGGAAEQAAAAAGAVASIRARAYTEDHARDSLENLMFGLCRFYEVTGRYPERVTVVSYTLKRARFRDAHRAAMRFPASRFDFVGTPVPPAATGAPDGEARTVAGFAGDPYGCDPRGELAAKRQRRDPFAVGPPHPSRCPAMAGLLRHCGPALHSGPVPWAGDGEEAGAGPGKIGPRGKEAAQAGGDDAGARAEARALGRHGMEPRRARSRRPAAARRRGGGMDGEGGGGAAGGGGGGGGGRVTRADAARSRDDRV